MFERFTDRARRVAVLAQEEARLLDHHYVGTEHLLLGLIHEGEGVAAIALKAQGYDLERCRKAITDLIGTGSSKPAGHLPFTPRCKKALELSLREALQLGHNYIGTEHLLLGLVRSGTTDPDGKAIQVLLLANRNPNISAQDLLHELRIQVIQILSGYDKYNTDLRAALLETEKRREQAKATNKITVELDITVATDLMEVCTGLNMSVLRGTTAGLSIAHLINELETAFVLAAQETSA